MTTGPLGQDGVVGGVQEIPVQQCLGKALTVVSRPHLIPQSLEAFALRRSHLGIDGVEKRQGGQQVLPWRAFTARVLPPPLVAAHEASAAVQPTARVVHRANDDLNLDRLIPVLDAAGLEPLPANGASEAEVEAWIERFIDASARPPPELDHA